MIHIDLLSKIIPAIYSVENGILPSVTDNQICTLEELIELQPFLVEKAREHIEDLLSFCLEDREVFLNFATVFVIGVIEKTDAESWIKMKNGEPIYLESMISTIGIVAAYYQFAKTEIESFRNLLKSL